MYIHVIPNRNSPPAILVRESYRENGKVKNRTVANVSKLPGEAIEALRRVFAGERLVGFEDTFQILPDGSRHHGHVEAVLLAMKRLAFAELVATRRSRQRDLVVAMVAARVLKPRSKLATTRWWHTTTLPEELGVADADEDDLYAAMDWLLERQDAIEKKLAKRHLEEGALALYDLSSSYFEGVKCPLAAFGYNRDGKKGKLQVNYGLLTNRRGIPVAVSVFKGNTADSKTLLPEVAKLREAFGIERFVVVGDRGMIFEKQIEALRPLEGIDWITALSSETLRRLVGDGSLQLDLFDEQNLFEVAGHPDFEGERLVACRNPAMAERRAKKRRELLAATVEELRKVERMVERGRLRGRREIRTHLEQALPSRMRPYVHFEVREDGFETRLDEESMVEALTRSTRAELDRVERLVEAGRLQGERAIADRVRIVLARRKVGRHIVATLGEKGMKVSIDAKAVVAEATAPLWRKIERVRRRIERGELYGRANIGVRVGKVINKYKMGKHFALEIRDDGFDFQIDEEKVAAEAALDGVYVIRTSLAAEEMDGAEAVRSYKRLSEVERAFRSLKSVHLKVRPIHHNAERRVRAHILLCKLASYVQWHMMDAWRPLLFADEEQSAKATRDPVAPAERSPSALEKARKKHLPDGARVHSFESQLDDLAKLCRNICRRVGAPADEPTFEMITPNGPGQQRAYDLLKTIEV